MNIFKRVCLSSFAFPFLFLAASCSQDLKEAEKVGSQLEVLRKAGNEVAQGFYISCVNVKELDLSQGYLQNKKERVENAQKKCGKDEKTELSKGHLKFASDVSNNFRVATSYISGLTNLASGKEVDFKKPNDELFKSIEELNTSIDNINEDEDKPLPDQAIEGGKKIFFAIVNFFQREYRSKEVKLAIVCANQPFQDFSNGLIDLVDLSYVNGVLKTEEVQLDLHYSAVEPERNTPSISALILREFQDEDFEDLENRKKRGVAFKKALKETSLIHSNLAEEFTPDINATDKELSKTCKEYLTKDKDPNQKEEISNIEIDDFDIEQLERIQIMLLAHYKQMTPIIEQLEQEDL